MELEYQLWAVQQDRDAEIARMRRSRAAARRDQVEHRTDGSEAAESGPRPEPRTTRRPNPA